MGRRKSKGKMSYGVRNYARTVPRKDRNGFMNSITSKKKHHKRKR